MKKKEDEDAQFFAFLNIVSFSHRKENYLSLNLRFCRSGKIHKNFGSRGSLSFFSFFEIKARSILFSGKKFTLNLLNNQNWFITVETVLPVPQAIVTETSSFCLFVTVNSRKKVRGSSSRKPTFAGNNFEKNKKQLFH